MSSFAFMVFVYLFVYVCVLQTQLIELRTANYQLKEQNSKTSAGEWVWLVGVVQHVNLEH